MVQFNDLTGLLLAVVAIGLIPFVAMVATSYAKIVVVLGLLRNALGLQQVPPTSVLNGVAIMVSCFKRDERESADGYFCFTLEHDVVRRTPWA